MSTVDSVCAQGLLPWFVKVSPKFYDDACDVGFGWEGWARDEDDAVRQALEECHQMNEREPEDHDEDVDPDRAKVLLRKWDPTERDFRNRSLGKAGEALIVDFERRRLSDAERPDLARKICWWRRRTATARAKTSYPSISPTASG